MAKVEFRKIIKISNRWVYHAYYWKVHWRELSRPLLAIITSARLYKLPLMNSWLRDDLLNQYFSFLLRMLHRSRAQSWTVSAQISVCRHSVTVSSCAHPDAYVDCPCSIGCCQKAVACRWLPLYVAACYYFFFFYHLWTQLIEFLPADLRK